MKNIFAILLLCSTIVCCACGSEDEKEMITPVLEVGSKNVYVGESAVTREISITSNVEWSASVASEGQAWCHVDLQSDRLLIHIDENTEKDVRKTSIQIAASQLKETIQVAQLGWGKAILVSPKSIKVLPIGEEFSFEVTANIEYNVEIEEGCNWIHVVPKTRSTHEMVTNTFVYKADLNATEYRETTIWVKDKDENSEIESGSLTVTQEKMKDNYESTGIEGIKEDIKVQVIRGEANKAQSISEGIEKTFDGDMNTIYHSPYNDNKVTEESPAILTYYFDEGADMDYLVYYPRTDGGANGRFKEVEIRVRSNANTYGTDEWTTVIKKNLGGSSSAARIDFPVAQIGVSAVQIVVNSGVGDFASCAEMEFYKKNPDPFDYSVLFTDASCSELKPGVTEEDIQNCNYSFFKNIAYYMYRQKYPREFRIAEFKAYPHPDIQKAINKTSAYSLLDNPTGIYVTQGQELVVLVADAHNEDMGICIQNLDKPGGDGFGGDTYPLTTGVNKIKVKNKGLVYVIYHTTSLEELAGKQPVKIHFASGKVNGYFDSNKHEASRWSELLNNTVCGYFDVLGTYAHLTFPVNRLRNSTGNRGKELIDLYDEIVEKEQIFMGLKKYGGMFMNRMYLNVMYHNFMYASDYHTAYHDDTMDELCNPDRLKTTGCWGPAHEIGHCNQTRPGLKWHGLTEVTNNIMSQYIQTTVWGNTSRLQSEGWYTKAWDEIIAKRRAHAQETDFFMKLVPFWQLELYWGKVKGFTPKESNGWDGFYPQIYEHIRKNPDLPTAGEQQLEFVYICCLKAEKDLTGFFRKWGFLTPVDVTVDDYGDGKIIVTQKQIDEILAKIDLLGFEKETAAFEYITDDNLNYFIENKPVQAGTSSKEGGAITLNNRKNVVAYEVENENGELVYVVNALERPYGFTVPSWKDSYKVYAVSAAQGRIEVTFNK